MNKVHAIEKEIPHMEELPVEKKACEYLYIEADEDHIRSYPSAKRRKRTGMFHGKTGLSFRRERRDL